MGNARLEHFLRTQVRTYRVALADINTSTGSTGSVIAVEILGVANRLVKLRHIQISKPTISITPYRLNYYSVASTGSTNQVVGASGSTFSVVQISGPAGSTYDGVVRRYISPPVAGTLVGSLQDIDLSTGDVMNEHYGDEKGYHAPTLRGSSESFGIEIGSTTAVVWNGYIEITEEGPST